MKLDEQKAKVAAKKDADSIQKQIDLKAKFKAAMKKTDDSASQRYRCSHSDFATCLAGRDFACGEFHGACLRWLSGWVICH